MPLCGYLVRRAWDGRYADRVRAHTSVRWMAALSLALPALFSEPSYL
jgi:hypothetical protein